jgi:hypothetical protein
LGFARVTSLLRQGTPVRLSFLGHNVITDSHFDNYTFDYLTFSVSGFTLYGGRARASEKNPEPHPLLSLRARAYINHHHFLPSAESLASAHFKNFTFFC